MGPRFRGNICPLESLDARVALVLFAVVGLLMLGLAPPLQARGLGGLAASELLFVALPALGVALVRRGRGGFAALGIGRPRARHLLGALLVGVSLWYLLAVLVLPLQERLFPAPPTLRRAREAVAVSTLPLAVTLLGVAVVPAVCEELLCRGAVLRALVPAIGRRGAVVASALLFAALHGSVYLLLPTFALGLSLGAIAQRTGSTWNAMLTHALNNATIVVTVQPQLGVGPFLERHALAATPLALAAVVTGHLLCRLPSKEVE
jgi:sodium transport system permease protein